MSTVQPPINPEENARVKAVFDDIRATRNTDFIGNVWRYLAFDPALLEHVWYDIKEVMATETLLDSKTKEMIYAAVSIANNCEYCIHSHTAQAKSKGMTDAEHAELIRIVTLATKTNALATALQVPVDPQVDITSSS